VPHGRDAHPNDIAGGLPNLSDFLTDHGVVIALICAGSAVAYGLLTTRALLVLPPGNAEMQRISGAVQEGARAYLNRQYTVIAGVGVVLAVALIFIQDGYVAVGFVIGGVLSGATGYIGMNVSVRANARVAGYYGLLTTVFDRSQKEAVDALIGLGFGGSLISVFARLGGGIFTKAADVGADLVGKVEAGIPEDDPRNPAVIADNVGDNVGDCAGMAADLFETYAVTAVAVMLLGVLLFDQQSAVALYPLVLGGLSIIASIIGTFAVRSKAGNVERALYQGLVLSALIAAIAFYPVTKWLMDGISGGDNPSVGELYLCSIVGIGVTACLFLLTDYYTSTRFSPVKKTSAASQTGHATNIIQGFSSGLQATALPALVLVFGIFFAWKLAGIYGIGVAVMGQLSLTGLIVALDAFGPITDNAGGIAEMADLPEEVRNVTDPLDAVGNTTKAVTKGYAIGSAVLAAIVLFAGFKSELADAGQNLVFAIDDPPVLMGLLIGGMMVTLFASLSVEEVRRQFREKPGIMEGTEQPDYAIAVDIVTRAAQREMILPAMIPILIPLIVGLISVKVLGGLLIGVIIVGFFFAVLMTAGGGAWDNAKKLIEDGAYGGKGSEAHAASVTGDTVGDPFKDTAGPAINPMIKVANIVAILIIPIIT
jgi:K(+)-stimulated pyrophosphate-energized sodium pump